MEEKLSIDQYLEKVGQMVDDMYGQMVRRQFKDIKGSSELSMLETPTKDEYEDLVNAVAIMTPREKADVENLTDEQILKIAEDAKVNAGNFAIFINGYALTVKKDRQKRKK